MLDARYKYRYFDADKKQGLREMLQTQMDKMETDTVTVGTEEEDPQQKRQQTEIKLHCLACMRKSWVKIK
jgi:hypothetical protein